MFRYKITGLDLIGTIIDQTNSSLIHKLHAKIQNRWYEPNMNTQYDKSNLKTFIGKPLVITDKNARIFGHIII